MAWGNILKPDSEIEAIDGVFRLRRRPVVNSQLVPIAGGMCRNGHDFSVLRCVINRKPMLCGGTEER